MSCIVVVKVRLPKSIGAAAQSNADGSYTILVNESKCEERQRSAVLHELRHIKAGDHYSTEEVAAIERRCHIAEDDMGLLKGQNIFYTS